MIKAIIFDCFGVLAEDGWLPLKRKYVGDNEELAQKLAEMGKQNERGLISNAEVTKRMAQLMRMDEEVLKHALNKKVPNQVLFEFIKSKLKPRYKIGLMSNANYDVLHQLFTSDQAACFEATVTSFEVKLIKPDERMYLLMAARLGVEVSECLYIDNQERYSMAAEAVGMQTITYKNNHQLFIELNQHVKLNENND